MIVGRPGMSSELEAVSAVAAPSAYDRRHTVDGAGEGNETAMDRQRRVVRAVGGRTPSAGTLGGLKWSRMVLLVVVRAGYGPHSSLGLNVCQHPALVGCHTYRRVSDAY